MYEGFYKLQGRPFQLMPDPRRLYETVTHTRGLSYLIYGLERGEGFVVVTGAVGTGKTLLVQVLLGQINSRSLMVARVAITNVDSDNVVATVAAAFGVNARGMAKYEMLDALVAKLSSARNRRGLLIIDEAQACSVAALEELRIVSNLQARGQALVQIVLVGQSELRGLLKQASMSHLRQRIVASYHLEPLGEEEVAGYIEHRLNTVGWRPEQLAFGEGLYERVYEWSGGVPRRINQIMDRVLLLGYLEELRELHVDDLNIAIEEFEAEFAGDGLVYDGADSTAYGLEEAAAEQASHTGANAAIDPLLERVAAVERALRAAFGEEQTAELMRHHETSAAHRELVEAVMRVERLESILNDVQRGHPRTSIDERSFDRRTAASSEEATEGQGSASEVFRRLFARE